jgi:16S rRNA (guanine(527)-N(7))-methyltransferase RsmG
MSKNSTSRKRMIEIFEQSGFHLEMPGIDLFWRYYQLLKEHNEELDLTRIKRFEDIVIKHFIDSIYLIKLCDIPSPLIDIGSGAGFPGIPLRIMIPDLSVTLAEPRHKRVSFLKEVIDNLNLGDIEIYPHMVTPHSFFKVNGVITRALEYVDKTLSRISHFLPKGGRVILMKGPAVDTELGSISDENLQSFEMIQDTGYTLPATGYKRRILIYRKTSSRTRATYRIFRDPRENIGSAITSRENRFYREIKKLTDVDGVKKYGKAIISGRKQIAEMLRDFYEQCLSLVIHDNYSEEHEEINAIIKDFSDKGSLSILKKSLFNEIDLFNTGGPLLIVNTPSIPQWDYSLEAGCNLLIPFQDPANVGAVIRSAAGFGVRRIILLNGAAHPFHLKAIRSSGGAVYRVPLFRGPSIKEMVSISEKKSLHLISLDKRGEDIGTFQFPEKFLLLPGIEGPGLPEELIEKSLSIPTGDDIESLNAAVATSIALFSWRSQIT